MDFKGDWKRCYDDMSPSELRMIKRAFEADLSGVSGEVKAFIEERLKYIELRMVELRVFLPQCGKCVYFREYKEKDGRGWCILGSEVAGDVSKNLLSLCPYFKQKRGKGDI